MEQFVVLAYMGALAEDSLNESHPILQEVSDPAEISALFDSISYDKVCGCVCTCKGGGIGGGVVSPMQY